MQKYWSDNQVSSTVSFKSEEADQIKAVLDFYRYDLKSISFLPRLEKFAYAQMPYEAITKDKFQELLGKIGQSAHIDLGEDVLGDRYCTNDQCMVV